MEGGQAPSSAFTRSRRQGLAPTPTGSIISGWASAAAALPQRRQSAKRRASGVPVFSTVAALAAVMAADSSGACAMMGLAPMASVKLAQSVAETWLDTQ